MDAKSHMTIAAINLIHLYQIMEHEIYFKKKQLCTNLLEE